MSERILIAGSNGNIGKYLQDHLRDAGYSVTGVGYEKETKPGYFTLDLTNRENVKQFVKTNNTFDTLIFLTGLAHAKGKKKQYDDFYRVNVKTLKSLLEEMRLQNRMPGKVIFSSTISVYGEKYNTSSYPEGTKLAPQSPYALTKIEAEKYLLENFKDISWILRFAPVYTPDFTLNIDRRTQIKGHFYKTGSGSKKLSLLSIFNILAAVSGVIEGKVPADTYNVSDKQGYSYNELLAGRSAEKVLTIPAVFVKTLYLFNKLVKNNFIEENSIKLLTDNVFPSDKLQQFIKLPYELKQIQ